MIDAEDREHLREAIITAMAASAPYACNLAVIRRAAWKLGFRDTTNKELVAELDYLSDKGFATPGEKAISPENGVWKITAAGRDYAAQNGLA